MKNYQIGNLLVKQPSMGGLAGFYRHGHAADSLAQPAFFAS